MKLYLLKQNENNSYDTYDSCVVCAENEADAKTISPDGGAFEEGARWSNWATRKEAITCEEIGEANANQKRGVIIASFNDG